MPYIRKTETTRQPGLKRLLRGYGLTPARMMAVLNVSENTARKYANDPGLLKLDQITLIARRQHIPAEELREAMKFA